MSAKRKIVILSFLCLLTVGFPLGGYIYHTTKEKPAQPTTDSVVYVCSSNMAIRYHSHVDCEGLQSCGGRIQEISKDEAEKQGRTPCHLCY